MQRQWILSGAAALLLSFALAVNLSLAQGPGPGGERNPQDALGTAFTYQGQLQRGGSPVDGPCDVAFRLYDAASAGDQVGSAISATVPIIGGLFTVGLDFGAAAFDGNGRWLGIRVKCDGDGDYADLGRQELTATPYAHYALHAPWSGLSNVPPGFADGVDNMSVVVSGTNIFAGEGLDQLSAGDSITLSLVSTYQLPQACANGAIAEWNSGTSLWECGLDDQGDAAWLVGGNAGTNPSTDFVGSSDNVSLTLAVNGTTALRLEPSGGTPNLIGGYSGNSVGSGVQGAAIGGGGVSGEVNQVTDNYGVVGGGYGNQAGDATGTTSDAAYATVGGGWGNDAAGYVATVAGGRYNEALGDSSAIGGGQSNDATALYATVGGGYNNIVTATYATIGGGRYNDANADYVTIGGGYNNDASGDYAVIGGGQDNTVTATHATIGGGHFGHATGNYATVGGGHFSNASGNYATVGGGDNCDAIGVYSTIAGGAFNDAIGNYATISGGRNNDAIGNYSSAAGFRAVANNEGCFVWGDFTDSDVTCDDDNRWVVRAGGGVYFYTNGGLSSGMYLAADGSAWNAVSARERKENLKPVDAQNLLARLAEIPIHTWNYKAQDPTIRHIGPMADEFNALVEGLGGEGEDYINTLDADGVALAAIQGLIAENVALREQLGDMETRLSALEAKPASSASPWQRALLPGIGLLVTSLVWVTRREGITIKLSRGGGQ